MRLEVLGVRPAVPGAGARATVTQVAARIGDSFFSLGPVLVLVLTGHQRFSWVIAPWLVGALLAQLVLDTAVGLARTRFAERVKPSDQPQMRGSTSLTSACP